MLSLSDSGQADIIEDFGSASGCLDDLLSANCPYFEQMVGQMCPVGLQFSRVGSSNTEAPFLGLSLSMADGVVSSKIYGGRDDFGFGIVDVPFLGWGVVASLPVAYIFLSLFVLQECVLV